MYAEGRMQWTTGDNSGGYNGLHGTEALAGINAGDYVNHVTVPGSQSPDIINITRTSNVDTPGVWMFRVGRGNYLHCVYTYVYVVCVWVCLCIIMAMYIT